MHGAITSKLESQGGLNCVQGTQGFRDNFGNPSDFSGGIVMQKCQDSGLHGKVQADCKDQ